MNHAELSKVTAPWTDEQVKELNGYQRSGVMHPFTCGGEHDPIRTARKRLLGLAS